MQQLGCESHSVTCVSCYVHVYGNKVIIIIIIIKECVYIMCTLDPYLTHNCSGGEFVSSIVFFYFHTRVIRAS